MKDVRGDGFAGSSPPFLGRERAAVVLMLVRSAAAPFPDDDVYYYIRWRLKLDDVSPVFFVFVLALLFSFFHFPFFRGGAWWQEV